MKTLLPALLAAASLSLVACDHETSGLRAENSKLKAELRDTQSELRKLKKSARETDEFLSETLEREREVMIKEQEGNQAALEAAKENLRKEIKKLGMSHEELRREAAKTREALAK